jgi:hypothetical protein
MVARAWPVLAPCQQEVRPSAVDEPCRGRAAAPPRERFLDCSTPDGLMVVDPQTELNPSRLGWTQQPPFFTPTSMPSMHQKPHCKALLGTMGNVMSRRVLQ